MHLANKNVLLQKSLQKHFSLFVYNARKNADNQNSFITKQNCSNYW